MKTANLLTQPRLRKIAGLADELTTWCASVGDALADYESADDLPRHEQAEAREIARSDFRDALEELATIAEQLVRERDALAPES